MNQVERSEHDVTEEVKRPGDVPQTSEMLDVLDQATQDIPKMLESLGNAIGTLVDRNSDPSKADVWERNLKGYSGQYYGRLATIQNTLRTVVRHLHTLGLDPNVIRPPLTPIPPLAFSTSQVANSHRAGSSESPEAGKNDKFLSLYAQRLELQALQQLEIALLGMKRDDIRLNGTEADDSSRQIPLPTG